MLFIGSCAGTFYALDKNTGKARWSYDIKKDGDQTSFHGNPLITEELILTGTDGAIGHIYAFERATGKVRWKYLVARGVSASEGRGVPTDIVRLGSSIYAVSLGDELLCLDLKTGRLKWSFQSKFARDKFAWSFSPVVEKDRVLFGALDGNVYALDAKTGKVAWERSLGSPVSTAVTIVGNDLYVGTRGGRIHRLNKKTGAVESDFAPGGTAWWTLAFTGSSMLTFLNHGRINDTLACLDIVSGKARWDQKAAKGWSSSMPYLWRDTVLAGTEDGELFAFKLSDGSLEWSHKFKGVIRGIGSSGDVLYIGTLGGTVYAYKLEKRPRDPHGEPGRPRQI